MTLDSAPVSVFLGLPIGAFVLWWGLLLLYRRGGRPAPGSAGVRLMACIALLGPAAVAVGLYALAQQGLRGPWETGIDRPAAVLLWAAAYAFTAVHVLASLAREASVAGELRAGQRRTALYRSVADIMDTPQKPRAALYLMLDHVMNEFGMDVGMVHLANERGELSLATYRNVDAPTASVLATVPSGDGLLGQVQDAAAPAQVTGEHGIRAGDRDVQLAPGIQHVVMVPLRSSGTTLGVLTLGRQEGGRLARDEMDLLGLVSSQIGAFVESRGLAQRSSDTAGVRGFLDPQAFVRSIEVEMARARRYGRPLAVASLRVSGWVQEGDMDLTGRVLRTVSDVIRRNLWVADYCTYHGSGRFSLLLPDTGRQGASAVLRRLAYRVAANEELEHNVQVRLEAAVVSYPEHGSTVDELLQELQYLPLLPVVSEQDDLEDGTTVGPWPAGEEAGPPAWSAADAPPQAGEAAGDGAASAWPGVEREDVGGPAAWVVGQEEPGGAPVEPASDRDDGEPLSMTAEAAGVLGLERLRTYTERPAAPADQVHAPEEPGPAPAADPADAVEGRAGDTAAALEADAILPGAAPAGGLDPARERIGDDGASGARWPAVPEHDLQREALPGGWPGARSEDSDAWWRALLSDQEPRGGSPVVQPASGQAWDGRGPAPTVEVTDTAGAGEAAAEAGEEIAARSAEAEAQEPAGGLAEVGVSGTPVEPPASGEEGSGWEDSLYDPWRHVGERPAVTPVGPVLAQEVATGDPAPRDAEDGGRPWYAVAQDGYEGYLPPEPLRTPGETEPVPAGYDGPRSEAAEPQVRSGMDDVAGPDAGHCPAGEPPEGPAAPDLEPVDGRTVWAGGAFQEGQPAWLQRIWPHRGLDEAGPRAEAHEPAWPSPVDPGASELSTVAGEGEDDLEAADGPDAPSDLPREGRSRAREWRQAAGWVQDAITETEAVLDFIRLTLRRAQPLLDRATGRDAGPSDWDEGPSAGSPEEPRYEAGGPWRFDPEVAGPDGEVEEPPEQQERSA